MSFKISNLYIQGTPTLGHKSHYDEVCFYDLTEPDGRVFKVSRQTFSYRHERDLGRNYFVNQNNHPYCRARHIKQANAWETQDHLGIPCPRPCVYKNVKTKDQIQPAAPNFQALIQSLQNEVASANQRILQLQTSLNQAIQDRTALIQQIQVLESENAALNQRISSLQPQLAMIPDLIGMCQLLQQQVAVNTNTLNYLRLRVQ